MANTNNYNLQKFETTTKMNPTTMNGLNSNFDTIDNTMKGIELQTQALDGKIGVINYGKDLTLVDGSPVEDMTNTRYYRINGLKVNGEYDSDYSFAIVFFWTSGTSQYVELITKYTKTENQRTIGKKYRYQNGTWTVTSQTKTVTSISSSSTDAEIPTAKCVYDLIGNVESVLQTLNSGNGV